VAISHSELSSHEEMLRKEFETGETLAHTLAYDQSLKQPIACSTDPRYAIQREDTPDNKSTNVIFSDAKDITYIVSTPETCDGLVCYILTPINNTNNIKVIFRGTGDKPSELRDIEHRSPGTKTFAKSKDNILKALNDIIKKFSGNVSLTLYGHSLGGSDAQNCFVAIMEAINKSTSASDEQLVHDEKNSNQFFKTNALTLMTYNSAGVTKDTAQQADHLARQLKAKHNIKLTCFWQLAAGDGVQQSGEASILAGIDSDIATVYLRKVWYENTKENSWQNTFNPFEIISAATHTGAAHTKHSSGPKASPSRDEIYSNTHSPRVIHDKLSRKSPILQSFVVQNLQAGLHLIGYTILQPNDCKLSDSMYAEPFVFVPRPLAADATRVTVEDVTHEPHEPEEKPSGHDPSLALIVYEEDPLKKLKIIPSTLKITTPDTPASSVVTDNSVITPSPTSKKSCASSSSHHSSDDKHKPSTPAVIAAGSASSSKDDLPLATTAIICNTYEPIHTTLNKQRNKTNRENISRRIEISMVVCMLAAVTIALAIGTYGIGLLVGIAIAGFAGGGILSKALTWLSKTCCYKSDKIEAAHQNASPFTDKSVPLSNPTSSKKIFSRLGCFPCLITAPQKNTQQLILATPLATTARGADHSDKNIIRRKHG
jgi:hypothetical protein